MYVLKNKHNVHIQEGEKYDYKTAFCLETQHFHDFLNRSPFPSTILESGTKYEIGL